MRKIAFGFSTFLIAYTIYTVLILFLFQWINPPITAFIQQKSDQSFDSILKTDKYEQVWMPINKISDEIKIAIITSEDQRFIDHWGFDVKQIQQVIEDFEKGKKLRGASTITQQVAKNLFLSADRTWWRKALESYYTLLIELVWSKKRILEVYLNIAEFGENIYGVEAASGVYFNKSSNYLNVREGAMLASILPNPIRYNLKRKSIYLKKRINRIVQESKYIDKKKIIEELK
ncbi:MAG: monofunctional biosynthetic peptidoglycan transglycosylase [Bacteroidota bacterium]